VTLNQFVISSTNTLLLGYIWYELCPFFSGY